MPHDTRAGAPETEVEYALSASPLGSALLGDAMDLHRRVLGDDAEAVLLEMRGRTGLVLVVARVGGRAVGYKLGYERKPRHYYSWLGGVDAAHRGRGIATELMRRQHRWCRDHGYQTVRTITTNAHRAMLRLNLAEGFDVIGTLVSERGEVRVVMEKRLVDAG